LHRSASVRHSHGGGISQVTVQVAVPVTPHGDVQSTGSPAAHSYPSSVDPSQSSSAPLHDSSTGAAQLRVRQSAAQDQRPVEPHGVVQGSGASAVSHTSGSVTTPSPQTGGASASPSSPGAASSVSAVASDASGRSKG